MQAEYIGALRMFDVSPVFVVQFMPAWAARDIRKAYDLIAGRAPAPTRVAFVCDVVSVRPAGVLERKELTATLESMRGLDRRVVSSVVISKSSLMRGVIRAVQWFHPTPYPIVSVDSFGAAREELERGFRAEGRPLAAEVVAKLKWVEGNCAGSVTAEE
jgi:hypothetical protein